MTWQEFKDYVDAQLAEHGADATIPIWFIDISYPSLDHESTTPSVGIGKPEDRQLSIS